MNMMVYMKFISIFIKRRPDLLLLFSTWTSSLTPGYWLENFMIFLLIILCASVQLLVNWPISWLSWLILITQLVPLRGRRKIHGNLFLTRLINHIVKTQFTLEVGSKKCSLFWPLWHLATCATKTDTIIIHFIHLHLISDKNQFLIINFTKHFLSLLSTDKLIIFIGN